MHYDAEDGELFNHPPVLQDYNLFTTDPALVEAVHREGADWAEQRLQAFGQGCGSAGLLQAGDQANRYTPELRTHDRFGHRVDEVHFHPAYHQLMQHAFGSGMHSLAWTAEKPGAHVAHAAMVYMMAQTETGVCCPAAMTYAAVPSLRFRRLRRLERLKAAGRKAGSSLSAQRYAASAAVELPPLRWM